MKYVNPKVPDGINVSNEHPLKELAYLGGGILLVFIAVVFVLSFTTDYFARHIPFEFEVELAREFSTPIAEDTAIEEYLQKLADGLADAQGIADNMPITVHYVDDDTINAFATLGGHIILYRGLLEKIKNENTLSMVISHEIAHIKHRHPIRALGRGVVIGLAMAVVFNVSGNDLAGTVLGKTGFLTSLSFNREQEEQADETALATLMDTYGHVAGAEDLFEIFLEMEKGGIVKAPEFLSTHPDTGNRIKKIRALVQKAGWDAEGALTTLPPIYKEEMKN